MRQVKAAKVWLAALVQPCQGVFGSLGSHQSVSRLSWGNMIGSLQPGKLGKP